MTSCYCYAILAIATAYIYCPLHESCCYVYFARNWRTVFCRLNEILRHFTARLGSGIFLILDKMTQTSKRGVWKMLNTFFRCPDDMLWLCKG